MTIYTDFNWVNIHVPTKNKNAITHYKNICFLLSFFSRNFFPRYYQTKPEFSFSFCVSSLLLALGKYMRTLKIKSKIVDKEALLVFVSFRRIK